MRILSGIKITVLIFSLTGCIGGFGHKSYNPVDFYQQSIEDNNYQDAASTLHALMSTNPLSAKEFLEQADDKLIEELYTYTSNLYKNSSGYRDVDNIFVVFEAVGSQENKYTHHERFSKLREEILNNFLNKALSDNAFLIDPNYVFKNIEELNDIELKNKLAIKYAKSLDRYSSPSDVERVLKYAVGLEDEKLSKEIISIVNSANLKANHIATVKKYDPYLADEIVERLSRKVSIDFVGFDKIQEIKLKKVIEKGYDIKIVPSSEIKIEVEKVRFEMREFTNNPQQMVFSQADVNLVMGALFMPRNSSYVIEYTESGIEVDYAILISMFSNEVEIDRKIIEKNTKEKIIKCSPGRIINAFGGVQNAGFYPNKQVKSFCESGMRSLSRSAIESNLYQSINTKLKSMLDNKS